MIRKTISRGAGRSTGASRLTTTPMMSDSRTGTIAPRRSARRPASGDRPDSVAAAARNVIPIASAVAPSRDSRSGTSTSTTPNARPATRVSHMPVAT